MKHLPSILLALLLSVPACAQNTGVVVVAGRGSALEMRRDLRMEVIDWDDADTYDVASGVANAAKLNAVLDNTSGRKAIVDPEGLSFAIATETIGGSCVTIPGVWGGTLAGVGIDDRDPADAESFILGSTKLIDVSAVDDTVAIEYRGWGWSLGGMTIVGGTGDSVGLKLVHPGAQSSFGTVPVGKIEAGALSFVSCAVGLQFADGSGNTDESLWRYLRFRRCAVGTQFLEQQAVGHTFLHYTFTSPDANGVAFDIQAGGNLVCHYGALLDGGTWLRTGGLESNSRRLHFDYVKLDSPNGLRQVLLEMEEPDPITLRFGGHIGSNSLAANAGEPYVKIAGHDHDIELDVDGLPEDQAIAFARKPYPTVDRTIFSTPDLSADEDYAPDLTNVSAWFDFADESTVTPDGTSGRIEAVTEAHGGPNVLVEPSADGGPLYREDGIFHRYTANNDATTKYLRDASPSSDCSGMEDLEVHVIASRESGTALIKGIASVWEAGALCWQIYFTADHKVKAEVSTNGTASAGSVTSTSAFNAADPLLITLRRDGSTGETTIIVNGEETSATIAAGSNLASVPSADLLIGTTNSSVGLVARVSVLVVKDALSSSGELDLIYSHFRKRFGTKTW